MIESVEIRNYQSLKHVRLELAPLTVIVGQSSSGKSAFTRALRTLTSNQRGASFITTGEKVCTISATTDRGQVVLTRGKGTNDNKYTVIPAHSQAEQRTYAKLGGETPPEVSEFIGIASKDPINYASQFDKPYLLADSPSEVARTLGALTNVNIVFEAARESNRRKLAQSSVLKTRATDLQTIKEKAQTYKPLKQQVAALQEAEESLAEAHDLQKKISRLQELVTAEQTALHTIQRTEPSLSIPVPDEKPIIHAASKLQQFQSLWGDLSQSALNKKTAQKRMSESDEEIQALEASYLAKLTQAGTCPTCGQSTHEEGIHA